MLAEIVIPYCRLPMGVLCRLPLTVLSDIRHVT